MNQEHVVVQCSRCGAKNRIPAARINDKAVCGKCHFPITGGSFSSKPLNVTDANFSSEVIEHPGPVLVDFWAPWCGPCRMVSPVLDELASKYSGRIRIAKVNVDENPIVASRYSIRSIPSLMLFKGGRIVNTLMGAQPKEVIEQHIQSLL